MLIPRVVIECVPGRTAEVADWLRTQGVEPETVSTRFNTVTAVVPADLMEDLRGHPAVRAVHRARRLYPMVETLVREDPARWFGASVVAGLESLIE